MRRKLSMADYDFFRRAGAYAAREGFSRDSCPPLPPEQTAAWCRGWKAAREEIVRKSISETENGFYEPNDSD